MGVLTDDAPIRSLLEVVGVCAIWFVASRHELGERYDPGGSPDYRSGDAVIVKGRVGCSFCGHHGHRHIPNHRRERAGCAAADRRLVRLVIARCSVDYSGRLSAHLPEATRLIMIKADGTLAIHSDGNASKPLNWMVAPNLIATHDDRWVVTNSKGETLTIWIEEILEDVTHDLGDDPGLQKDGVEAHLQELLAERPWVLEEGLTLVRREFPTDIGPVDLLCADNEERAVAVEVKRRGEIDGVEQLVRYLERLDNDPRLAPVRGIFAAQSITPQARVLAEARGIDAIEVDYDGLREAEDTELRLFDIR